MTTHYKPAPRDRTITHFRRTGHAHTGSIGVRSTHAGLADSMRAIPFLVNKPTAIDAISIEVTSAGAASQVLLALYTNNNGFPDALVPGTTSAELDTSTTGLKRTTFTAVKLQPQTLYWLVIYFNSSATPPTIRGSTGGFWFEVIVGIADNTAPGSAAFHSWVVTRTYDATMPATFPATSSVSSGSGPLILVEVV